MLGVELLDATQVDWGFSLWDISADLAGSAIYIASQKCNMGASLKFFYAPTIYPDFAPELLGKNTAERIIKDYNGQSYWLSIDIPHTEFLTLDIGYSADGLIGGRTNPPGYNYERIRQFYISPGINLEKLPTKKKWLKTILKTLNIIKIPFPAVGISSKGNLLIKMVNY
jgi:hypothetical protein